MHSIQAADRRPPNLKCHSTPKQRTSVTVAEVFALSPLLTTSPHEKRPRTYQEHPAYLCGE